MSDDTRRVFDAADETDAADTIAADHGDWDCMDKDPPPPKIDVDELIDAASDVIAWLENDRLGRMFVEKSFYLQRLKAAISPPTKG